MAVMGFYRQCYVSGVSFSHLNPALVHDFNEH